MKIRILNDYTEIWPEMQNMLIYHQRMEDGSCHCGWTVLGASFAGHLTKEINGLLISHIEEVEIRG